LIEHWWQPGDVLVIDNYMVLHGRGVNDESASSDRKLLRASVE
jgi:alpha-ketoglutarate-dependent taurine dioxygenase